MDVDDGGGRHENVPINYPANSKRPKTPDAPQERAKQESVVTGKVVQKKPSTASTIIHGFFVEDLSTVVQFALTEVALPAVKEMFADVMTNGLRRMLYGEVRSQGRVGGYTPYSTAARTIAGRLVQQDPRPPLSKEARTNHDFNQIMLETKAEAEDVIEALRELIIQYQVATVADLYDLVGLTGDFTDNRWGWDDLRSAAIQPVRGGFLLKLPRTQPIA